MTGRQAPDPYLVPHITEALAQDPRTAALDIHVQVTGEHLLLTGDVATPERRAVAGDLVAALAPGLEIHNALTVTECPEPDGREDVS